MMSPEQQEEERVKLPVREMTLLDFVRWCPNCGWSESSYYDVSDGQEHLDENGWIKDQWGGLTPPRKEHP